MPVGEYFGGHGESVMKSMKKKHGGRGEEVFYKTSNKKKRERGAPSMTPKSKMPKGVSLSPKGDIGQSRQLESVRAGGFKAGPVVVVSKKLPYRECKKAKGST